MRVYKKKIALNKKDVKNFFEGRVPRLKEDPLTAVLYQDSNPELAYQRNEYEKKKIIQLLKLNKKDSILDVGCGIGRWVEILYKKIESYFGIDFQADFIEYAKEEYKNYDNVSFLVLDATKISSDTLGTRSYSKILIAGLLLYLNDKEVKKLFENLKTITKENALIYLREPIAIEERLSLKKNWSKELNQEYSALYRTKEELFSLISGFEIMQEGEMYTEELNNRKETKQYYFILRKI